MDIENVQTIIDKIELYNDRIVEEQEELIRIHEESGIYVQLFNEYTRKKTKAVNDLRIKTEELNKVIARRERLEKTGEQPSKRMINEEENLIVEIDHLKADIETYKSNRDEARGKNPEDKDSKTIIKINNEKEEEINKKIEELQENIQKNKESLNEIYEETVNKMNELTDKVQECKNKMADAVKEGNLDLLEGLSKDMTLCIEERNNVYEKYNSIKKLIEKSGYVLKSEDILESKMIENVDVDKDIIETEEQSVEVENVSNEEEKIDNDKENMYAFDNKDDAINFLENNVEAKELEPEEKDKKTKKTKKKKKQETPEENTNEEVIEDNNSLENVNEMSTEELYETNREAYNDRMVEIVEKLKSKQQVEPISNEETEERIFTDESRIDENHQWMSVANASNTNNLNSESVEKEIKPVESVSEEVVEPEVKETLENPVEEAAAEKKDEEAPTEENQVTNEEIEEEVTNLDNEVQEIEEPNLVEQVTPEINSGLVGTPDYNELINQQSQAAFNNYDAEDIEDLNDEELEKMALEATNPEELTPPINDKDLKDIGNKLEQQADRVIKEEKSKENSQMQKIDARTFAFAGGKGIVGIGKLARNITTKIMERIKNTRINPGTVKDLENNLANGRGM